MQRMTPRKPSVPGARASTNGASSSRPDVRALVREFKGETRSRRRTSGELQAAYARVIDWLVRRLEAEEQSSQLEALSDFDRICLRAGRPDAETERAALCKAILARLGADHSDHVRVLFLKTMRFIARGESVNALARLLSDPDARIRELARQALQNNPTQQASNALRRALETADQARLRVAYINAIGYRRDAASVALLSRSLEGADAAVARAAASALGKIGGAPAADALKKAGATAPPEVRDTVHDALISCAEQLAAKGDRKAARAIYRHLQESPNVSFHVRDAVRRRLDIRVRGG